MPEVMDAPVSEELDLGSPEIEVEGSQEPTEEQVDQHDEPQEGETGHLRGKELYRAVKDKLKNGEKLSPQELKSIRNAIHIAGRADEATGGDLNRFEAERQTFEQLRYPGEESYTPEQIVEQYKGEREQLYGIFKDIEAGAPALIEELATDYPDSFPSLAVQAMDKFAQTHNEAFTTYVAKSAFGYLSSQQVPQQFALLDRFLPESSQDPATQIVIDAFKTIKTALHNLGQFAARPLDIKKPAARTDAQGNPQETDLASRENNMRRYEWDQKAAPANRSLRDSEIKEVETARKMQLTEKERASVLSAVKEEWETRLKIYGKILDGYLAAGNEKAYTDRILSEGKKMLASMTRRHTNEMLDKRPKNGKVEQTKSGQKQIQQPERKDATGATWLSGSPASLGLSVDYSKTTQGMLVRNEAYIKGRPGLHKWKARVA